MRLFLLLNLFSIPCFAFDLAIEKMSGEIREYVEENLVRTSLYTMGLEENSPRVLIKQNSNVVLKMDLKNTELYLSAPGAKLADTARVELRLNVSELEEEIQIPKAVRSYITVWYQPESSHAKVITTIRGECVIAQFRKSLFCFGSLEEQPSHRIILVLR
jgi:hypothetical protein